MKIHIGWAVALAISAVGLTIIVCNIERSVSSSQDASMAGQTLANLSKALELHKTPEGTYPETLEGITIENTGGDYSDEFLHHVIYRRTEDGFVAFVGLRGVAYIEKGASSGFKFVR